MSVRVDDSFQRVQELSRVVSKWLDIYYSEDAPSKCMAPNTVDTITGAGHSEREEEDADPEKADAEEPGSAQI